MSEILHAVRVKRPEYLNRYLSRMIMVLSGMATVLFVARDMVFTIVQSNIIMNGMIAVVFVVGVGICFRNVHRLKCDLRVLCDLDKIMFESRDAKALVNYDQPMFIMTDLYKSMESSTKDTGEIPDIPTPVARSMVNIANNRFEERRIRISYFVNLLIYMGLLGTFIGLSATVGSISGLISNLAMGLSGEQEITETLVTLIKHLEEPLAGMGTAFGTSLTGLSSSVVLGALAMSVNKAATLFSNIYSNWIYEYAMTSFTAGIEKHKVNQAENASTAPAATPTAPVTPVFSEKSEQLLADIEQHLKQLLVSQQTLVEHHEKQLSTLNDFYQHALGHHQAVRGDNEQWLSLLTKLDRQLTESSNRTNDELQKQTRLHVEQYDRENSKGDESATQREKLIASQQAAFKLMKKLVESTEALCQQSRKLPDAIATAASERLKETEQALAEQFQNGQDELSNTIEKAQSSHRNLLLRIFHSLHRLYRLCLSRK